MLPASSCKPVLDAQLLKTSTAAAGHGRSYKLVHVCAALALGWFASFAPYLSARMQGQDTQCGTRRTHGLGGLPAMSRARVPALVSFIVLFLNIAYLLGLLQSGEITAIA